MGQHVSNFSRGGQVWAHKIRMGLQVFKNACLISFSLSILVFVSLILMKTSWMSFYVWGVSYWADLKSTLFGLRKQQVLVSLYSDGQWYNLPGHLFETYPFVQYHLSQVNHAFDGLLSVSTLTLLLKVFGGVFFSIYLYFFFQGKMVRSKKHKKGVRLVTVSHLKRLMKLKQLSSPFHLDGVPLVKGTENTHMLIAGTTGSGKTNALNHLIPQLRNKNQKAIVVDVTGDMTDRYFNKATDIILSPGDERSSHWNLWSDSKDIFSYKELAHAFIGEGPNHDPFWTKGATACLAAALDKLSSTQSLSRLTHILLRADLKEFSRFLSGTHAATFADEKGERTTVSIRSTLVSQIQSLEVMKDQGDFSIQDWIANEKPGFLFLTTPPRKRTMLCPLITAQLSVAMKGLMDLGPSSDRKLWFLIDELPALNKVPSLPTLLAEGRKYGACVVTGVQDIPQLETRYGYKETQTLVNQMNTKVLFRFTDPNSAKWASKVLGEHEEKTTKENLSYGANTIRDGVSVSESTDTKAVVTPTDISSLKNLECYIKLPQNLPLVKHKMKYTHPTSTNTHKGEKHEQRKKRKQRNIHQEREHRRTDRNPKKPRRSR